MIPRGTRIQMMPCGIVLFQITVNIRSGTPRRCGWWTWLPSSPYNDISCSTDGSPSARTQLPASSVNTRDEFLHIHCIYVNHSIPTLHRLSIFCTHASIWASCIHKEPPRPLACSRTPPILCNHSLTQLPLHHQHSQWWPRQHDHQGQTGEPFFCSYMFVGMQCRAPFAKKNNKTPEANFIKDWDFPQMRYTKWIYFGFDKPSE